MMTEEPRAFWIDRLGARFRGRVASRALFPQGQHSSANVRGRMGLRRLGTLVLFVSFEAFVVSQRHTSG